MQYSQKKARQKLAKPFFMMSLTPLQTRKRQVAHGRAHVP